MKTNVYFDRSTKVWVAYLSDETGQLGDAEYAPTQDLALFNLGAEYGRNPARFARVTIDDYNVEFLGAKPAKVGEDY